MRTNLNTTDPAKQLVIDYLEENASDVLVEKINRCKKTIDNCWVFITDSARKRATNGCAAISDSEVFGWAVHYFEEEGNVKVSSASTPVKTVKVVAEKKKPEPKKEEPKVKKDEMLPGQMTIFDLMGGQ